MMGCSEQDILNRKEAKIKDKAEEIAIDAVEEKYGFKPDIFDTKMLKEYSESDDVELLTSEIIIRASDGKTVFDILVNTETKDMADNFEKSKIADRIKNITIDNLGSNIERVNVKFGRDIEIENDTINGLVKYRSDDDIEKILKDDQVKILVHMVGNGVTGDKLKELEEELVGVVVPGDFERMDSLVIEVIEYKDFWEFNHSSIDICSEWGRNGLYIDSIKEYSEYVERYTLLSGGETFELEI